MTTSRPPLYDDMEPVTIESDNEEIVAAISSDGEKPENEKEKEEVWLEEHIAIRPTALVPEAQFKLLPISLLILRFTTASIAGNIGTTTYPEPIASLRNWVIMNLGREFGVVGVIALNTALKDALEYAQAVGYGNPLLGLLISSIKILVSCVPSAAAGLGIGCLIRYFENEINSISVAKLFCTPPMSGMAAALFSPWIYIGTRKLVDRIVPPPEVHYNGRPPLHWIRQSIMVVLTILDSTNMYNALVRSLIYAYGDKSILHHPRFPLGAVGLYILFQHVIDPLAFGRRTINEPPPFGREQHSEDEELEPRVELLPETNSEPPTALDNYELYRGNVSRAGRAQERCDSIKNTTWITACIMIAAAASVGADFIATRYVDDKESLSDTMRFIYTSLLTAVFVGTYFLLVKSPALARRVADSSCWATLFNRNNRNIENNIERLTSSDALLSSSSDDEDIALEPDSDTDGPSLKSLKSSN